MADISVYTDPGTYIEEKIAQGAVTLGQVPLAVTLIGPAAPNRVFSNETVVRGQVSQTLTLLTSSPHTATLSLASNQSVSSTSVTRDGTLLPVSAWTYLSSTSFKINDAFYKTGSVYVITYIAPTSMQDALVNAGAVQIDRVGSFPSVTSFMSGLDYQLTSNKVDWSILTVASLTGTPATPFNLSTNHFIKFSLDGLPDITVDVVGATPSATTATEVVAALNAALSANISYGAPYAAAASVSTTHVKLSGIVPGKIGSVVLKQAATFSAHLEVFGVATVALPLTVNGTGSEPVLGSVYYVTYEVPRPNSDFNTPFQFFSPAAAFAIVGFPDISDPLANYVDICFANGSPSVYCIIIKGTGTNGAYTDLDFINGIAASEAKAGMTEILPMSTSLNVQVAGLASVINMSSLLEKKRRRLWLGMARNTAVGDMNTAGTYLYMSGVTLQVPGDSPGRGRFILTAPGECTRTILLQDGSQVQLSLDGTALAAATAAVNTGFTSASTTLLQKLLVGFDSITDLSDPDRKNLASHGVSVVSLVGGKLVLTDPVTTEVAGGGLQEFSEISVMVQKDKTAVIVEQQVTANLLAIVPEDLADFINDIKEVVAIALKSLVTSGDIGKYTNSNGTQRDINIQTDVQAFQSTTDKTKFTFRYWFNGRYPAKRFFGQFSVDNPFFAPSQQG